MTCDFLSPSSLIRSIGSAWVLGASALVSVLGASLAEALGASLPDGGLSCAWTISGTMQPAAIIRQRLRNGRGMDACLQGGTDGLGVENGWLLRNTTDASAKDYFL